MLIEDRENLERACGTRQLSNATIALWEKMKLACGRLGNPVPPIWMYAICAAQTNMVGGAPSQEDFEPNASEINEWDELPVGTKVEVKFDGQVRSATYIKTVGAKRNKIRVKVKDDEEREYRIFHKDEIRVVTTPEVAELVK